MTTVCLAALLTLYWILLFKLLDNILLNRRFHKKYNIVISVVNVLVILCGTLPSGSGLSPYLLLLALMLVELLLMYRERLTRILFCYTACIIHVLAIRAVMLSVLSVVTGYSTPELASQEGLLLLSALFAFLLLDLAIVAVRKLIPMDGVRAICERKEQLRFMTLWMAVNVAFLLVGTGVFRPFLAWSSSPISDLGTALFILLGLYITLFFAIKTSTLLANTEENSLVLFQDVMNHLENFIYVVNPVTFQMLFMNEKTRAAVSGADLGALCYSLLRGNDCQCDDCPMRDLGGGTTQCRKEIYNKKLNIWVETTSTRLRWRDGSAACLISCADITPQKEAHRQHIAELEKIAYVDEVTGGYTFYRFKAEAARILQHEGNYTHLIIKMDIENFSLLNQIYGYQKGNEILRTVAAAITQTVRSEYEIFARVGKDEFVALFTMGGGEPPPVYETFLQHFLALMGEDLAFRFRFPHGSYVVYPGKAESINIDDMFEKVNMAHKAAKRDKAHDSVLYDESMTRSALHNREIESRMEAALREGEFMVYLQPKYWLEDQSLGGAEALVRWKSGSEDMFFPDSFIPLFEQNGFVTKLDMYMLDKVCGILADWLAQGLAPVVVSVNFSRLHLSNPDFVLDLQRIVDSHGIDHKYIEIEITETVIYDHFDRLKDLLAELHAVGFQMSMDDFGSGYSSLGMLKNLPVDVIKMDSSFFADQIDEARSQAVLTSVIEMAKRLNILIVAEGIEDEACFLRLREMHCELGQGYYFARPMPAAEFTVLLLNAR